MAKPGLGTGGWGRDQVSPSMRGGPGPRPISKSRAGQRTEATVAVWAPPREVQPVRTCDSRLT
jgi:hypothetical protein